MDDWTRVLLYGTFDGFTYSTDDLPRIVVVLDDGERVEVPKECVISADQMVNKNKIKLKDVIARIKSIDFDSQEVWLNEILNELGSDYGSLKYRAGYEQGRFDGAMEREKVTVPQFVADYIKYAKESDWDLIDAMKGVSYEDYDDLMKWFYKDNNQEIFAQAWIFGYEVEKEKQYLVKIVGMDNINGYLSYNKKLKKWFFGITSESRPYRSKHTRKELEDAGFGEVFNCPLFEIEEVEE